MREIQKNTSIPFASQAESIKKNDKKLGEQDSAKIEAENKPVTEDLSKSPEAVIGRSQVNPKNPMEQFKAIENDIKDLIDNPEEVEKTMKFFDKAVEITGSYEKATEIAEAYRNEFLKK